MRSVAQVAVVLVLVGFIGWLIDLLATRPDDLSHIAMALCAIVGLYVLLVGAENVSRVMVEFGAAKADVENNEPPR